MGPEYFSGQTVMKGLSQFAWCGLRLPVPGPEIQPALARPRGNSSLALRHRMVARPHHDYARSAAVRRLCEAPGQHPLMQQRRPDREMAPAQR